MDNDKLQTIAALCEHGQNNDISNEELVKLLGSIKNIVKTMTPSSRTVPSFLYTLTAYAEVT